MTNMLRHVLLRRLLIPMLLPALLLTASIHAEPRFTSTIVNRYAQQIFEHSAGVGMVLVAIDNDQRVFVGLGETYPGNHMRPTQQALVRIASLSKLMTSQVMVKLAEQGYLGLNDPLDRFLPDNVTVPAYTGEPIRLIHLATHTSGLPREQPNGDAHRDVFVWPTRQQRWQWLKHARLSTLPGTQAAYSNLGYDLLADALARATRLPYPTLLKRLVTRPLGMKDTTYTPSPEQCKRLMIPAKSASPCNVTLAAIGSGGLYSTAGDMTLWMQQFLSSAIYQRSAQADRLQTLIYQREQLTRVKGLDVPGRAAAIGLGWVAMAEREDYPVIIQKTGGGGGFITYIAMSPQHNIGVFVTITRSAKTRFTAMSDGVNDLIVALIENQSSTLAATRSSY